ncbi:MAG: insulinase family protein [Puniceicoccales bacterium]|jgi:zinc protease|nr:insulinase family protein [Puniceicoccales bacterium]
MDPHSCLAANLPKTGAAGGAAAGGAASAPAGSASSAATIDGASCAASGVLSTGEIFGEEPRRRVLPNGLEVHFAPEHGAGLLSAQVWVRTGSIHEAPLLGSGVSHFVEHMVFKGTRKYGCRELSQVVQSAGASINAYTTFDRTVYYLDGPAECAETAFDVLSEIMFNATFAREDAVRERDVVLREIDMGEDDPDTLFSEAVLAEAFHRHPYRLPVIGLRDVFSRLTHEQIVAYYRERYTPNNMVLVVAGALDEERVFSLAQKYFGHAPAAVVPAPYYPDEPVQLAPRSATIEGDVRLLRGALAWHIPGMRHPDTTALDVFTGLLGNGESSRLNRRLHNELGIVHDIDASNWAPGATGLLWLSYTADTGRRAEVERAVAEVVASTLADGFSDTEFAKARRVCLMSFLQARKTVHDIARQLGVQAVIVGDAGYPRLYLERVNALTPSDVLEAARRHIRPNLLTSCAMEPRRKRPAAGTAGDAGDAAGGDIGAVARSGLPPFTEHHLANGMRVLLQPSRAFPKVNFRAAIPGGGVWEPADRRGLGALLATLLTLDTETRSAAQVAEAAETLGASLCESAGNNSIGIAIEVLPCDAAAGASLLADALLRPALAEKTFLIERDAQRAAIHEEDDDVVRYGHARMRRHFFGKHPLAVGFLGERDALERATAADARALYTRLVRPENCVLAVCGDFDARTALADLENKFGRWNAANAPAAGGAGDGGTGASGAPSETALPAATGRIEETRAVSQAVVFLGFPDTGIVEEDFVTGSLIEEMLNGMASQIFMTVREERGMAYFVGAARVNGLHEGMFYLHAGTIPQHVESVLEAMRRDIARLREGRFIEGEIESAKARLRVVLRTATQTIGARAQWAVLNALYGLEVNRGPWLENRLNTLAPEDIRAFAARWLREERSLAYIVRPE